MPIKSKARQLQHVLTQLACELEGGVDSQVMTVKIVTDSVADLPSDVVRELGIMVVPLGVRFGTEVYRDGIDLTAE